MENEISGVLLVNKHAGVTSHDIVFKIRKLFQRKNPQSPKTAFPQPITKKKKLFLQ